MYESGAIQPQSHQFGAVRYSFNRAFIETVRLSVVTFG